MKSLLKPAVTILVFLIDIGFAFGTTFILQSGKRIEGTIVLEEAAVIRVKDTSGIELRLKKGQLNLEATREANPPVPATSGASQQGVVGGQRTNPSAVRTFTNEDILGRERPNLLSKNWSVEDLTSRVRAAERDYNRLTAQCRSAGAGKRGIKRTEVYVVDGKKVAVTGYYADPSEVQRAKSICLKARRSQSFLESAKQLLQNLLQKSL